MIELQAHDDGTVLPVRAQPGAKRAGVKGERAGRLLVAVTAPPDKGRANEAIRALVAQALSVARQDVELLTGATSRDKRLLVRGLTVQQARTALAGQDSSADGSPRDDTGGSGGSGGSGG